MSRGGSKAGGAPREPCTRVRLGRCGQGQRATLHASARSEVWCELKKIRTRRGECPFTPLQHCCGRQATTKLGHHGWTCSNVALTLQRTARTGFPQHVALPTLPCVCRSGTRDTAPYPYKVYLKVRVERCAVNGRTTEESNRVRPQPAQPLEKQEAHQSFPVFPLSLVRVGESVPGHVGYDHLCPERVAGGGSISSFKSGHGQKCGVRSCLGCQNARQNNGHAYKHRAALKLVNCSRQYCGSSSSSSSTTHVSDTDTTWYRQHFERPQLRWLGELYFSCDTATHRLPLPSWKKSSVRVSPGLHGAIDVRP